MNTENIHKSSVPNAKNWLELSVYSEFPGLVAGVDEVGRGALFGPVVAAAVILPSNIFMKPIASEIKDSKKLSGSCRNRLAQEICQLSIDWKIGFATTKEIDHLNILQATYPSIQWLIL